MCKIAWKSLTKGSCARDESLEINVEFHNEEVLSKALPHSTTLNEWMDATRNGNGLNRMAARRTGMLAKGVPAVRIARSSFTKK